MRKRVLLLFVILPFISGYKDAETFKKTEVVFCLDLSGSTNGLIEDFRNNFWHLISSFHSQKNEKLSIGIVCYGRNTFGKEEDYTKIVSDLTEDYETVFTELMKLKPRTENGTSIVGSALYKSVMMLGWSKEKEVRKTIYLVGNGDFKSGQLDKKKAMEIAKQYGIRINVIYCNTSPNSKPGKKWEELAAQNNGQIITDQIAQSYKKNKIYGDAAWLVKLNDKLNETFIYYGSEGKQRFMQMKEMDKNLEPIPLNFYSRILYKTNPHYSKQCSGWDLVSYVATNEMNLTNVDTEFLPDSLKRMTYAQLFDLVKGQAVKRKTINDSAIDYFIKNPINQTFTSRMDSVFVNGILN